MAQEISNIVKSIESAEKPGIDPGSVSSLTLAFLGDSVFETILRTLAIEHCNSNVNSINAYTKKYSNAVAQARISELLEEEFTEEEFHVFKRGRNAKSVSAPKSCSISEYRKATGLETLTAHLYLSGSIERLVGLIRKGVELLDEQEQSEN